MKLSIKDLGTVYEDVYKVRPQWYNLGLQLRVPPDTLDSIKSERLNPGESLHEALKVWLKRVNPWPTWSTMIEALSSPTVGELRLADQLERKYCDNGHTEEPQSQARKSTSRICVHRCQFHTLIKEFLDYVQQINHSDIYVQTSEQFRWSYQVYYSQVLANSSQLYIENIEKVHIITALENDIHNIRELFEMLRKEQLTDDSTVRVGHSLCSDLLSEVLPKIELLKPLMKVISLMITKLITHMSEVSGINDGIHLYLKLFSQARLYLTAIDSGDLCYTMCLDLIDKDKILHIQSIKEHFSVNEELLLELEALSFYDNYRYLWACDYDCMIMEQGLNYWLTHFGFSAIEIIVLMIGVRIWISCFGSGRYVVVPTIIVYVCLFLGSNLIDYYSHPFILNSVNPRSYLAVIFMAASLTTICLCTRYCYSSLSFGLLTMLLLPSAPITLKFFPLYAFRIAQNRFYPLMSIFVTFVLLLVSRCLNIM